MLREPDQSIPDPAFPNDEPPKEWDKDVDGKLERDPTLDNGKPWPRATPDSVIEALRKDAGRPRPSLIIFVPRDGRGPLLLGSDGESDFSDPPGYDRVMFYGTPQETQRGGARSGHAVDGVSAALEFARTDRFQSFYFNCAVTTSTDGGIVSWIRPDVMAVSRPELNLEFDYFPYESHSPGQNAFEREMRLRLSPRIAPAEGRFVKFLLRWWSRLTRGGGGP